MRTIHPSQVGLESRPTSAGRRQLPRWFGGTAVILIALGLWELGSVTGAIPPTMFPSMSATMVQLLGLFVTQAFWVGLWNTISSWALGLALTIVIAVPLGILLGSVRAARLSSRFLVDFLRSVPKIAILPIFVLLLGPNLEMKLLLIVYGAMWPVMLQTMYGVADVDKVIKDTAFTYRLSIFQRVVYVIAPSTLPYLLTGFRIATVSALLLAVSAEVLGSAPGLGLELILADLNGNMSLMYAYVLMLGLLGVAIHVGTGLLQRTLLRWHPSVRGDLK